jgi:hypothetical protein
VGRDQSSLFVVAAVAYEWREREREKDTRDGKECIWSLFVTFFAFFLPFIFFFVASFLEAFFSEQKFLLNTL